VSSRDIRKLIAILIGAAAMLAIVRIQQQKTAPTPPPSASSKPTASAPRASGPAPAKMEAPEYTLSASPSSPPSEEKKTGPNPWDRLIAQPATPERDAALADALQQARATSADDAERQFLALHPTDRMAVAAATLAKAASRSADEAVREAIRFCDEDPDYALDHGRALIAVLADHGHFNAALDFVVAEDNNGWLGENGHKWLSSLFTLWATSAPERAAEAALASAGPGRRSEALQIVAAAWAKTNPAAAANFAVQLPDDTDRRPMLAITLTQWAEFDRTAVAAWMADHKMGEALDADAINPPAGTKP
jgi:hypothetical protein